MEGFSEVKGGYNSKVITVYKPLHDVSFYFLTLPYSSTLTAQRRVAQFPDRLRRCEFSLLPSDAAMATGRRRKQVCLFGLSGDPPTGDSGHTGIVKALSQLGDFDEVRVLPVYRHNFAVRHNVKMSSIMWLAMSLMAIVGKAQSAGIL
jgi:hypothetical protein